MKYNFIVLGDLTIEPSDATIWFREGKVFNITCRYTGTRATDVTWKINGTKAKTGYDVLISKQMVNSLNISQVAINIFKKRAEISDSGYYECIAGHQVKGAKVKVTKGNVIFLLLSF